MGGCTITPLALCGPEHAPTAPTKRRLAVPRGPRFSLPRHRPAVPPHRYTRRLWGEGGGSSRAPLGEVLPSKADGTGQDETPSRQPRAPPRTGERQRRRACERSLEKDQRDPECATSLALVSLPPADWRTILPTRSVFLPIGFCFPLNLWLPAAGAVLAAPCCAAPSPQGRDGGGERGWHLRAGGGRCRRHLPSHQRHNVALEALRPLPTPDGQRC